MYVITGATGHIGSKIAEQLLAEGKQVRAIARDGAKLATLKGKGAEIAQGNIEDTVFLAKAMVGAEGVFILIPPNLQAEDIAAEQDRVGTALVKAVSESGVRNVVFLSSLGAELSKGNGPIAGLHRQELRLNALTGVNVLNLRPGYFMENLISNIPIVRNMGINGSAVKGDLRIPQIATKDIATYAAGRLARLDFSGKEVQELLGERNISMQEATKAIGAAIGKPDLPYVQFPYEDALKGMMGAGLSRSMSESYVEMSRGFNEGLLGKSPRNAGNTTPTSIEAFAPEFARGYGA
ncbi:MAG: NmrA family NAD(P)-binding protein [Fibrobacteria bacterium]